MASVLFISNLFYPDIIGGVEMALAEVQRGLQKLGYSVTTVCLGGDFSDTRTVEYGRVIRLPRPGFSRLISGAGGVRAYLAFHARELLTKTFSRRIRNTIREVDPDVIVSAALFGFGVGVSQELQHGKRRWIHTVHSYDLLCKRATARAPKHSLRCPAQCNSCRMITCHKYGADSFREAVMVYNSNYVRDFHLVAGLQCAEDAVIPPVFIDIPFLPASDLRSVDIPQLAFVGRLVDEKGASVLCRAAARMKNRFHLHVIGSGYLESTLRKEFGAVVTFYGFLNSKERNQVLGMCDAVVIPSLWAEPFGRAAFEALAGGMPVIAADVGGLAELIQRGQNGVVFSWDTTDPEKSLETALSVALESLATLKANARQERQRYSGSSNLAAFHHLLRG